MTTAEAPRVVAGEVVGETRSERFRAFERRYAAVSRVLDDLVPVPGTSQRVGLDPVIGLVPWIGDLVSAGVGLWLIAEAARFKIPTVVLARMLLNTLVDLAVGAIPTSSTSCRARTAATLPCSACMPPTRAPPRPATRPFSRACSSSSSGSCG